jgi:hypothetical protein
MYDNLFVFFDFFNLLFDIFLKSISAACFCSKSQLESLSRLFSWSPLLLAYSCAGCVA